MKFYINIILLIAVLFSCQILANDLGNILSKLTELGEGSNEEYENNLYKSIHSSVYAKLKSSHEYTDLITELLNAKDVLGNINSKNSVLAMSFIDNAIIWAASYNLIESDGLKLGKLYYIDLLGKLKIAPERLLLLYNSDRVLYKNPISFEEHYKNIVYSRSHDLNNNEEDLFKRGKSLVLMNLKPYKKTVGSENSLEYFSRVIMVDKLLEVNFFYLLILLLVMNIIFQNLIIRNLLLAK